MKNKMLSQDLPENMNELDIFPEDQDVNMDSDIMVDEEPTEEQQQEGTTEAPKATTENEEPELTLDEIFGKLEDTAEQISDTTENITEGAEDIQQAVEEIKTAAEDGDDVTELVNELYETVLTYSTEVETLKTKNDMLLAKLRENNEKMTDYEIQLTESKSFQDPDIITLNRDYTEALSGGNKDKAMKKLEDMYYKISGKTMDQTYVDGLSGTGYSFNESTTPTYEEKTVEEDIKDISSIF